MAKYLSEAGLAHLWTNILKPLFSSKVDKVTGKGLSSLDFTQAYLNRIGAAEDGITTLGSTKVDKIGGKGLSTNDFTTAYKDLVDQNAVNIATLSSGKVDVVAGKGLSTNDLTDELAASYAAKANMTSFTVALPTLGWEGSGPYTQTVNVAGMLNADNPIVDIVLSETATTAIAQLAAYGLVGRIDSGNGTITAICYEEKPAIDLSLMMKAVR